jgi:hypothetical protein
MALLAYRDGTPALLWQLLVNLPYAPSTASRHSNKLITEPEESPLASKVAVALLVCSA